MRPQFHAHQRPYDMREVWADSIVQIAATTAAVIGGTALLAHVARTGGNVAVIAIYVASLVAMLGCSATYNIWPVSPVKWWLRRIDHAAIYLLIAGTYTPLLAHLESRTEALALGIIVWGGALIGMCLKFIAPGRFDRVAIAIYLGLGWVGVLSARSFIRILPVDVMVLIATGGLIYSAGVVFHMWDKLRYQNAIWHTFVAIAAACHFAAIALLYR